MYATISFISYFGTGLCIQLSAKRLPPPPQLGAFSGRNLYGENICKGINVAVRACVDRGSVHQYNEWRSRRDFEWKKA